MTSSNSLGKMGQTAIVFETDVEGICKINIYSFKLLK